MSVHGPFKCQHLSLGSEHGINSIMPIFLFMVVNIPAKQCYLSIMSQLGTFSPICNSDLV